MRKTSRLFCPSTIRAQLPLLYFVKENYIVLPVSSTHDFCESSMRKKAFILGTKEQQAHPVYVDPYWKMKDTEKKLIDEIDKKEKMHSKYLVFSPDLANLAMYYLMQNRLHEAQAIMQRAVELEKQLPGCTGCLPGWTNLAIIRYHLNSGDKNYYNHVFEFCVEGWYRSHGELGIKALPYFYNLLAMGNDTAFSKKAADDFLNSIYPTLNSEHPFYNSCTALREILQQPKILMSTSANFSFSH